MSAAENRRECLPFHDYSGVVCACACATHRRPTATCLARLRDALADANAKIAKLKKQRDEALDMAWRHFGQRRFMVRTKDLSALTAKMEAKK